MKKTIRLTVSDLRHLIKEAIEDEIDTIVPTFSSNDPQFNINSEEWKSKYDDMLSNTRNQKNKRDSELMKLQVAHHNGMKGKGSYEYDLPKGQRQYKKRSTESMNTILSNGLARVNKGMSPAQAFTDFEDMDEETQQYILDDLVSTHDITPIGYVYDGNFILMYDGDEDKYILHKRYWK